MFFDLHNDFPTVFPQCDYDKYLSEHAAGGIVTAAIFTTELDGSTACERVKDITARLRSTGMPIAIEDMGFVGDGYNDFDFSPYFYCSLTWNFDNRFAGGALGESGLTSDGRALIDRLNAHCALDLAHINEKSFFDALRYAKRPMCSHTGFNDHPRSLSPDMIKAIIARRGIIGLSAVVAFTDARSVGALAETIDGFVQNYGADNIALGTDLNGTVDLPDGFTDYRDISRLKNELSRLGYDGGTINKILYENALAFYKEIKGEGHLREPAYNAVRR